MHNGYPESAAPPLALIGEANMTIDQMIQAQKPFWISFRQAQKICAEHHTTLEAYETDLGEAGACEYDAVHLYQWLGY